MCGAVALEDAGRTTLGDLRASGQATGEAYVRFALSDPDAYRLMFDMSQPHPDRYPELVRASARARHVMSAAIEALVKAGIFVGDPQLLGHVFWATMHGLIVLHLAGKLPAKPDFRAIQREAMRLLVAGARSGAAVSPPPRTVTPAGSARRDHAAEPPPDRIQGRRLLVEWPPRRGQAYFARSRPAPRVGILPALLKMGP